jgi:hypothetical protein
VLSAPDVVVAAIEVDGAAILEFVTDIDVNSIEASLNTVTAPRVRIEV